MPIIDAHIHLGANQHTKYYPYEQMRSDLDEAGADGAVVFAFPEDIYRITDTPEARVAANEAVLAAGRLHEHVYPFYFVWGDYILPENLADYVGVKWLGRRYFFRAPIHHTFQHRGAAETKVVVRFWIISLLSAVIGLATLKLR